MCNDFGYDVGFDEYVQLFGAVGLSLRRPESPPNLKLREDIWPTDLAPVIRRRGDGVELVRLRWGVPPTRPKAPPVINFRSEGRRFPAGRCLVPASHFYEFGGEVAEDQMEVNQDRRGMVLSRGSLKKPEAELLRLCAAGELTVERVR